MTIIRALQNWLKSFDAMELRSIPTVAADNVSSEASSYALAPSGNGKVTTDIL